MLNNRKQPADQAGFSVLELMVVLFVAGILMTVGLPAFTGFVANNRMSTAANDLATTLHLARSEAIKRRASVAVCPSDEWDQAAPNCTNTGFENGWIVFIDALATANPDLAHTGAQDILYAHGPMPDGLNLRLADGDAVLAGAPFLVFGTSGFPMRNLGGDNAVFNFHMCDHRGDADAGGGISASRWIRIAPTGRPQIYREVGDVTSPANPTNGC